MSEAPRNPVLAWLRYYWVDLALVACALAFGWCTLLYPFGRDQGLYYYVGREWALHGSVPYRDVLDHKTPGIYLVHALLVALFGQELWAIRAAELLAMVAVGVASAHAVQRRGARLPRGLAGFATVAASVFYFGIHDFRETGEGEVWLALFAIVSFACVNRAVRPGRAYAWSGLAAAASLLMKPSAVWFVLITVVLALLRVREQPQQRLRRTVHAGAFFAAGAAALFVPIFGYLGLVGALHDFVEIVGHANAYYVTHESGIKSLSDVWGGTAWWEGWVRPLPAIGVPLSVLCLGFAVAKRNGERVRRHGVALASLVAGYASVVMQGKFYMGHWSVMAPPVALVFTALAGDWHEWLSGRVRRAVAAPASMVAAACVYVGLYACGKEPVDRFVAINRVTYAWLHGTATREEHLGHFVEHAVGAQSLMNYQVGVWLREHSAPNDYVAVRGFQPQIYAWAHRRYPGRFFWTTFIVSPVRAYRRAEWLAEDRAALSKNPPRFVVALPILPQRPEDLTTDMVPWWARFGYTERTRIGDFVILEHTPETATETL